MLIKNTKSKTSNRAQAETVVTPPTKYITKVATVRLQYTNDHWVAFGCFTHDLKPCWLMLPAKNGADPSKISAEILNYDLYYPDVPSLKFQSKRAARAVVARKGTIAISNGWLNDRHDTFIYSDRVFHAPRPGAQAGSTEEPLIIACPDFDTGSKSNLAGPGIIPADMAVARVPKGTRKGWMTTVARPALYSSPMMLAITAVFGAPLLGPMDIDPFILYFAGGTSGGKTTGLLPPASAIGIGKKGLLPTWKNTDAGLELQAHQEYADMAFPIDELSHVGSDSEIFKKIDSTAYMFDAGVNKKMQDRAGSAISGRPRRVTGSRAILITSYERTLAEIETIACRQFRDGVRVRFIEIPMSVTKGAEGIFDKLPKRAGEDYQRTKFANKLTKDLRRACAKNSGKIFIAYIQKVVADRTAAKKFVRARMDWFKEHAKFDRSKREEYRRAEHFAFLYGAGAYAIKLGFLPWTRPQLLKAIRACYRASRASVAAAPDPAAALEASLMQRLSDAQRVVQWPKRGRGATDSANIDGWQRQEVGHTAYRIKATAFRRWFPSADTREAVEQMAISEGMLVTGKKNARCYQERVPGGEARMSMYQFQVCKDGP